MTGRYAFDLSQKSVVLLRCSGEISDDAFRQYLAEYTQVVAAGKPYCIVLDLVKVGVPNALQRKMMADWMRQHQDRLRVLCRGGAFVIQSTAIRGVMTAILWLQPMPFEYVVVRNMDEAVRWVAPRVQVPPDSLRWSQSLPAM